MSRKAEQKFITELKKSIKLFNEQHELDYFWYKIPDNPHMGTGQRFDLPKPFDILYMLGGDAFAIEAKMSDGYKAFSLHHMRPSQIENLTTFDEAGGYSFVALNIRQSASKPEGKEYVNKAIFMPWDRLHDRLKHSSIKAKELKEAPGITGRNGLFNWGEYVTWDPSL